MRAALADPACIMVNRNQGAGTRILIDRLLGGARPDGYWNQPRSHNAVAAAVAQHRADWGMTIAPVAHASSLGFIPLAEEHYDFALVTARKQRAGGAGVSRRAGVGARAARRWSRRDFGRPDARYVEAVNRNGSGRDGNGTTAIDCDRRRRHGWARDAAAALRRVGIDVTVYEQATQFARIGAGIQIGCNAMKVLRGLGLESTIARQSFYPRSWNNRDWRTGEVKFDMIFGESAEAEIRRALSAGASRRSACGARQRRSRRMRQAQPQAGRAG